MTDNNKINNKIAPYASTIIRLLQGVVSSDDRALWDNLINYQVKIKEYFEMIGLEVYISESDGFAFLRQKQFAEEAAALLNDENKIIPPELIRKQPLSYSVSLLCVLLIERLIEFDAAGGDSTRLILSKDEIRDMMRIFLSEKTNEAKVIDKLDADINKLIDYGFLKKLNDAENDAKYEVRRILKAKVPIDKLLEIRQKLESYAGHS
jgi:hypothetical protein